jgi:hypothetical protein
VVRVRNAWRYDRRFLLIVAAGVAALAILVVGSALIIHMSRGSRTAQQATPPVTVDPDSSPTALASAAQTPSASIDLPSWHAIPPVPASVSAAYPRLPTSVRSQPDLYAKAWASELFAQDYVHSTRQELIQWAQYESAPAVEPGIPESIDAKVLVDSLTDPSWDGADPTPIPANGPWLSLTAQRGYTTVNDVRVQTDPDWETKIADGYTPPDRLMTMRVVSATVTLHTLVAGRAQSADTSVSIKVMLGSSPRHDGYAAMATGSYTVRAVN